MEKKTSTKIEEKKSYCYNGAGRTNLSPAESHNLQTKSSDLMAALQNPATSMISRANEQQVCFKLKSPALLIEARRYLSSR
jgi:hypothetical protein